MTAVHEGKTPILDPKASLGKRSFEREVVRRLRGVRLSASPLPCGANNKNITRAPPRRRIGAAPRACRTRDPPRPAPGSPRRYRGNMSEERWVWGVGLATTAEDGTVLDTWYPSPEAGRLPLGFDPSMPPDELDRLAVPDARRAVAVEVVALEIDLDEPPASTSDAYLRLHALSHRIIAPNEVNLDGIFGHLPNVAWTNAGPMHPDTLTRQRPFLAREGIQLQGLDKFPRLLDYVTPPGVRIADASPKGTLQMPRTDR